MTLLQIDNKTEQAWRCQARSSGFQAFRRDRSGFGTPDRLEMSFSSGPHYYLEVVLTERILVCGTDLRIEAADVSGIDTAAKTLQIKTGATVPCRITDRSPNDKEQEFIQQERLIAAISQRADTQVAMRGMAASEIRDQIYMLNKSYSAKHGGDLFKTTNKSVKALATLDTPATDKQKYGELIDSLYFLIYEGSGSCERLGKPPPDFAMDVKFLRTDLRHDVDHGDKEDIAKKMKRAGKTFLKYSTKQTPEECSEDDLVAVQAKLLARCLEMLKNLASPILPQPGLLPSAFI